jgi:hypothetical protein
LNKIFSIDGKRRQHKEVLKKVVRKSGRVFALCANRETRKSIQYTQSSCFKQDQLCFSPIMHRSLRLHIHPHTFLFMHVSVVFFSLFGINLSVSLSLLTFPVIFYGLLSRILACRIDEHVWTGMEKINVDFVI